MLKNDEAFKIFSKLFFEKGLKYQVQTDYELLKLPKRLDVVVIKGDVSLAKRLHFFSYFKQHNIISFKSFTDRLKKADLYDALIYSPAYAKNERLKDLKGITVTVISAYQGREVVKDLGLKQIREGIYEVEGRLGDCLRLVVLNEVELQRGEWDLGLIFMFAGKKKLWELKEWLKENRESFEKGKEYFLTILPLFRKEALEVIKEVREMGRREFVIDIAENLRYLKSLGFKVKTYEEIFGEGELKGREKGREEGLREGLQRGLQQGLQEGLQQGLQEGLQKGLQQGLQEGLQEGLREAILLGIELRFGKEGLRCREELEKIKGIERLKGLKKAVLEVKSLKEFEEVLKKVKEN